MLNINLNRIDINNKNFFNILKNLNEFRNKKNFLNIEEYIKNVIYNIKNLKEKSLKYYLKRFENILIKNIKEIEIDEKNLEKCFYNLDSETRFLLELSKNRIQIFHEEQKKNFINNWKIIEENGNIIGQKFNKIENMGFYIPSGKALYPSSILMNIVPAKVSKTDNIVVCSPKNLKGNIIKASLFICGVKKFYSIGGIPAIASMAFGNKVINKVDKICGPGNIYVSISKKLFFGNTGIDMIAGPSEITIITDKNSDLDSVIMDIFSQSEHDKLSQSIIICDDYEFLSKIEKNIKNYLPFLYRKKILYNSIINNVILIKVNNINDSFNILNYLSPEHLIISLKNGLEFFKSINNAGSNFLDKKSCESFGDYSSGCNHVIPTNRNCRYSSPLCLNDFYKNLNFLKINNLSFNKLFDLTLRFSKNENLYSHRESLIFRN